MTRRYTRYYLSGRYSGKIYSYNQELVLGDSITVFDLPAPVIPAIDRSKEPLRYLLETFQSNFKRRIVDFLITSNLCYALITEDAQPVLYKRNLLDNRIRKFILPRQLRKKGKVLSSKGNHIGRGGDCALGGVSRDILLRI